MVNTTSRRSLVIASCALLAAAQLLMAAVGISPAFEGGLADSDCYQRLGRALDLIRQGGWHESRQDFTNAPFGEVLHWTRPLDLLLILGALPAAPFLGWERALFLWGTLLSPLLEIAAFLVLVWGARRHISGQGILILACLLALAPSVTSQTMLGRPDHHALLLFLYAAALALFIRLLDQPGLPRLAQGLGLASAMALWVSAEGLAAILLGGAPLAFLALRHGAPWWDGFKRYALWLAAGLCAALIAERPPADWAGLEFDRLSGPMAILFTGFAAALHLFPRPMSAAGRTAFLALAALAGLGAGWGLLAITGGNLAHPFLAIAMSFSRQLGFAAESGGNAPLREIVYFFSTISEGMAIYPTSPGTRTLFFSQLGGSFLALIQTALWSRGSGQEKRLALLHALGFAVIIPLSVEQLRWAGYAQILALLPVTLLVQKAWSRFQPLWRTLAALGIIAGPVAMAALSGPPPGGSVLTRPPEFCRWQEAAQFLRQTLPSRSILLTHAFQGPLLAYVSGLRTVGSPFHRNIEGNSDMLTAFRDASGETARHVAQKRGVTHLLICPADAEGIWLAGPAGENGFYAQLARSQPPDWLAPLTLPPSLSAFKLYEIKRISAPAPSGAAGHSRE
jgi:hypothetical protein